MLQDCESIQTCQMKPAVGKVAQRRPQPSHRRPSGEIRTSAVYGFLVSKNQFKVLQSSESAVSQSQVQREDRLVDPRSTRLSRLQAQSELMARKLFQVEEVSTLYPY